MLVFHILRTSRLTFIFQKCNMDRNASPSYQEGSPEQSLAETQALITHISSLSSPLVQTILTPRFAIACSDSLLSGLGSIASEHPDMAIQTHISENKSEVAFTAELFPSAPHYAGVYDAFGLLRKKTILAHGVLLTEDELALIKEREAGVSHCPTSNFNLRSGMAKVGEMLDRGIKVSSHLYFKMLSVTDGPSVVGRPRDGRLGRLLAFNPHGDSAR